MTRAMQHCDDTIMEHCDEKNLEHCDDTVMEHCDEKNSGAFSLQGKEISCVYSHACLH